MSPLIKTPAIVIALVTLFACEDIQAEFKKNELLDNEALQESVDETVEHWDKAKISSQQALVDIWDATKESSQNVWLKSKESSADLWLQGKEGSKQVWGDLESNSKEAWSEGTEKLKQAFEK